MGKSRRTKKQARAHAEQKPMKSDESPTKPEGALEDHHEKVEVPPGQSVESDQMPSATDPVSELQQERDALMDQLLRARAEFDNYRKRVVRESEALRQRAAEAVIHDLLAVIDNLDLALMYKDTNPGALSEGVGMVARQMHDLLGRHGLTVIDSEGKSFDPSVHEAVSQVPSNDVPKDGVVQELQKGYLLGGRVLRPSKVIVSAGPVEAANAPKSAD
jgi:molecular chaperone GrpE